MKKSADYNQISIFDLDEVTPTEKFTDGKKYNHDAIRLPDEVIVKLQNYDAETYIKDVEILGLEKTWDHICQFVIDFNGDLPEFINVDNFGELYEIGLATQDKFSKKKSGQYYTPDDVAHVMSEWLTECEGAKVCDVACGTGKLILTYLDMIGFERARKLIADGNLYLYDFDNVALKICRTTIAVKYGLDIAHCINDIFCDFLDRNIILPDDCKVISNPPYARIDRFRDYWEHTEVLNETSELYSAFMEKIFKQAKSTVIITPFSFINGSKYYSLRKAMCAQGNGFVVAFDNVPGNIFCGRKHGIFNTNTANSVRAAITVLRKSGKQKGFRVSPLIRFKNDERKELLRCDVLEGTLPPDYQFVDSNNTEFKKVHKSLSEVFEKWVLQSDSDVKKLTVSYETKFLLDIPNTCRYFTTACSRKLQRTGSITLYLDNEDNYNLLYCLINSSFAYWWWRVYDGGITYPVRLLNSLPVPLGLISEDDKKFFADIFKKMRADEDNNIIRKVNAGVAQENIKFPDKYRSMINARLLKILGCDCDGDIFDIVHANRFTEE